MTWRVKMTENEVFIFSFKWKNCSMCPVFLLLLLLTCQISEADDVCETSDRWDSHHTGTTRVRYCRLISKFCFSSSGAIPLIIWTNSWTHSVKSNSFSCLGLNWSASGSVSFSNFNNNKKKKKNLKKLATNHHTATTFHCGYDFYYNYYFWWCYCGWLCPNSLGIVARNCKCEILRGFTSLCVGWGDFNKARKCLIFLLYLTFKQVNIQVIRVKSSLCFLFRLPKDGLNKYGFFKLTFLNLLPWCRITGIDQRF